MNSIVTKLLNLAIKVILITELLASKSGYSSWLRQWGRGSGFIRLPGRRPGDAEEDSFAVSGDPFEGRLLFGGPEYLLAV